MSLTFSETFDGSGVSQDADGFRTRTRRFVVSTTSINAALAEPLLPKRGDPHPDENGYVCRTIRTEYDDRGVVIYTCEYTTRTGGSLTAPDINDPSWYEWGWGRVLVQIDIPVFRKTWLIQAGNPNPVQAWEQTPFKISQTRCKRTLKVRVTVPSERDIDAIGVQANRLHRMPDGKTYRFEGGDAVRAGYDTLRRPLWDISYGWELDYDILLPDSGYDDVRFPGPAPNTSHDGPFLRKAYHVFNVVSSSNLLSYVPWVIQRSPYDFTPESLMSWRELPGASRVI